MKNQYVADVNDYRKYGLLRALSGGGATRTGVCWMLTPDDERTDGQLVDYLQSPEQWRWYDPPLFDLLRDCVVAEDRSIRRVESSGILPGASFFSDVLSDAAEARRAYFARMRQALADADLIFFDPDNGLEVKSCPFGRRHSSKYLFWHELADTFSAGHSVLLYQHFPRVQRDRFVAARCAELRSRLGASYVMAFRSPRVVFFLVPQPRHARLFTDRSAQLATRWDERQLMVCPAPGA